MGIGVHKVLMNSPNDVSALERLIADGAIEPGEIVAVIGKTEGNGGANDFTRGFATLSFSIALGRHLGLSADEVAKRIAFVWSGGTEGVLSPACDGLHAAFQRARGRQAPVARNRGNSRLRARGGRHDGRGSRGRRRGAPGPGRGRHRQRRRRSLCPGEGAAADARRGRRRHRPRRQAGDPGSERFEAFRPRRDRARRRRWRSARWRRQISATRRSRRGWICSRRSPTPPPAAN